MTTAHFIEEPRDDAYKRLIGALLVLSREFLLVVRGDMKLRPEGTAVLEQLGPLAVRREAGRRWPGGGIGGTKHGAVLHFFRCAPDALPILSDSVGGLYDWKQPLRPEDLSFWDRDSHVLLGVTAHESMAWLEGSARFIAEIRAAVGGRFLGPALEKR